MGLEESKPNPLEFEFVGMKFTCTETDFKQ